MTFNIRHVAADSGCYPRLQLRNRNLVALQSAPYTLISFG